MACRRCCRCSSMLASSAPCLPYRISFHVAPRGGVRLHPFCPCVLQLDDESSLSFPPCACIRSARAFCHSRTNRPRVPAVACCRVPLCVCLRQIPEMGMCFLLRVPPSVAALLSLSGLHRRPSVRT